MQPLISVIMTVYNNERYFPNAVKSVLSQDYKNFELIIVDGGSIDKTPEIADKFAEKDNRLRVFHMKNLYIYASLNIGVAEAKGKYVCFLNSDDTFAPGALQIMADIVINHNPDVVWTKVLEHKCDEEQNITVFDYRKNNSLIDKDVFYNTMEDVRNNYIHFLTKKLCCNQLNLYRSSLAKKHKFRNDFYGADAFFNIAIANDICSAYICSALIYNFYYYENNRMNASIGKYYGYEHEMFNELYKEYLDLFRRWNILNDDIENTLDAYRISCLKIEHSSFLAFNCQLNTEEKIKRILKESIDEMVYNCALKTNRLKELDIRILLACNEIFSKEAISSDSEYYFVYDMFEAIRKYEKSGDDIQKIKYGIYHKNNPYHIGKTLYEN